MKKLFYAALLLGLAAACGKTESIKDSGKKLTDRNWGFDYVGLDYPGARYCLNKSLMIVVQVPVQMAQASR